MDLSVFVFIHSVGLPIAAAFAGGYFVFLTLKFILAGATSSVKSIADIVQNLDKRIEVMNTQLQKIDVKVTHSLGLEPDYYRIARGKIDDQRRD